MVFIKGWHPYSKCHEKHQFYDKGRWVVFLMAAGGWVNVAS